MERRKRIGNKTGRREYTVSVKYILFTGGGSAGHVIPNLAVMHEIRFSCRLAYMGAGEPERTLAAERGYPFFGVEAPKLVRSFTLENFKIPYRLAKAKKEARALLEREKPDLVFSKGGFASYPAVWAAAKLGIPVLTHESDLSPGLCTRLIAKKCKFVLTSFPETASLFANGMWVGSPIRREVLGGERGRAMRKFGLGEGLPVLLVLGGGSGSKALNEAVTAHLPALLKRFRILHLTGRGNAAKPQAGYFPREFEGDMGSAYAAADFVLCRAGSNTVFEALALKKPTLLVPLERGSRGDQTENALYFQKKGLCRVLAESELSALPQALCALAGDEALKRALATCSVESGTEKIVSLLRSLLA